MTTLPRARLAGALALDHEAARVARTVRGYHSLNVAEAANAALLDGPAAHFEAFDLSAASATAWSFGYVRSAQARFLELRAVCTGTASGASVRFKVSITDGTNTVTSSNALIPYGFRDNVTPVVPAIAGATVWSHATELRGWIDVETAAATLSASSRWSVDVEVTTSSAHVLSLSGVELPRWRANDAATAQGAIPGNYLPRRAITDHSATGLRRLLATLEAARTTQRTYLSTAWPRDTSAAIPQTTGTSYAALTNLAEGATYRSWIARPRIIAKRAVASEEDVQFRVLYRLTGGAGTETASVQMRSNASGSPFALTGMAHTGTSWAWTTWKDAKFFTGTGLTDLVDSFGFEAKVSAAGPTLYVASIHVREAAT